jgi:hypothetical protein
MLVRLSPCRPGPLSASDRVSIPPELMELSGPSPGSLVPGRRLPARWRTRPNHGWVRRAVVKIYHGHNIDHQRDMWPTPQEKPDK